MAKLRKANRLIEVPERHDKSYLLRGYDQINEKGEVVKRATGGRTVSLGEYNKVVEKLEALEKNGNNELEEKVQELKDLNKEYEAEIERLSNLLKKAQQQRQRNK